MQERKSDFLSFKEHQKRGEKQQCKKWTKVWQQKKKGILKYGQSSGTFGRTKLHRSNAGSCEMRRMTLRHTDMNCANVAQIGLQGRKKVAAYI